MTYVDLDSGDRAPVVPMGPVGRYSSAWLSETEVLYHEGNDHVLANLDDGTTRVLDVGVYMRGAAIDERWIFHATRVPDVGRAEWRIFDLETGNDRVVTSDGAWTQTGGIRGHIRGAGGQMRRDRDRFLYSTQEGDQQVLWSVTPTGTPRRMMDYAPGEIFVPTAVFGDDVVFPGGGAGGGLMIGGPGRTEPSVLFAAPDSSGVGAAEWSRDGSRLAFFAGDDIRVLDIERTGGSVSAVLAPTVYRVPGEPLRFAWDSNDGGLIVSGLGPQEDPDATIVWHLDLTTGRSVRLSGVDEGEIYEFTMSPSGRRISYYTARTDGIELWRYRVGDRPGSR